jgi:hypothetical protein
MSFSLKKLWTDYGIGVIVLLLVLAYAVSTFAGYLTSKGDSGFESFSGNDNTAYVNHEQHEEHNPIASMPLGQNEVFASANGIQTSSPGVPASCANANLQNPAELLPKDSNSQWAQLNPSGKGELSNINLLKAGYHIGIDTIGQTLRNANLQIRSEPPNPQVYVGPWNMSTIEPDFMRPPLEIGAGNQ